MGCCTTGGHTERPRWHLVDNHCAAAADGSEPDALTVESAAGFEQIAADRP